MDVTVLGCGSAVPTQSRHQSGHYLQVNQFAYLIDCGEGTQSRMMEFGCKMMRIRAIFITHAHGDHYFGLPSLLSTMALFAREEPLQIYAPFNLTTILEEMLYQSPEGLPYQIDCQTINSEECKCIYSDSQVEVYTLPLEHSIPCCGYKFVETPKRSKFDTQHPLFHSFSPADLRSLLDGQNVIIEGVPVQPEEVFLKSRPSRSYAYCSDTRPNLGLSEVLSAVDLLYHEATYCSDLQHLAESTFHSTAKEAAEVALRAHAKNLLIGHFSSRYRHLDTQLTEARSVFPNTSLALEGQKYKV